MVCLSDLEMNLLVDDAIKNEKQKKKQLFSHLATCEKCFEIYISVKKALMREAALQEEEKQHVDSNKIFDFNLIVNRNNTRNPFHIIQNFDNIIASPQKLYLRGERDNNIKSIVLKKGDVQFHFYFSNKEMYLLSHQHFKLLIILVDGKIHYHSQCNKNQEILLSIGSLYDLKYNKNNIKFQLTFLS